MARGPVFAVLLAPVPMLLLAAPSALPLSTCCALAPPAALVVADAGLLAFFILGSRLLIHLLRSLKKGKKKKHTHTTQGGRKLSFDNCEDKISMHSDNN